MLRAGYPTLLPWRGSTIYPGSRPTDVTTRSPRMVAECLSTRSMLIKMYYHFMVCACICTIVFHLISSQSLNLGGRRGTTDDIATIPFHPSLSSAATGNLQSPFPSIPWCYLPISSSVFLSFLLLSLSLAELSSPCPRILRCCHTIWVSFSLPWLGDHRALQLHSGFCCEPPRSSHGLCRKYSEVSYSISSQGLGSFSRFLLSRSSFYRPKGK